MPFKIDGKCAGGVAGMVHRDCVSEVLFAIWLCGQVPVLEQLMERSEVLKKDRQYIIMLEKTETLVFWERGKKKH